MKGTVPASSFSCSADRQERRPGLPACRRPDRSRSTFRKTACCSKRAYWPTNTPFSAKVRTTNLGPFGEVIRSTGPMAKANPFRFSTKYQDDETDLLYYGYRYYNASTGRWLSEDPINESGFKLYAGRGRWFYPDEEKNLYRFVGNNPNDTYDLYGLLDPGTTCRTLVIAAPTVAVGVASLPAEAIVLGVVIVAEGVVITYELCTGRCPWAKRCKPCNPPVGTGMYRTDSPPSRPHWINGVWEPIHTHHMVVTQRSVDAKVGPCKCDSKEVSATAGATPGPNEIPEVAPTGGGVTRLPWPF